MIQGYVFDLDGTLLNTLASIAASFNRCLRQFGHPEHPVGAYRYFVGDGQRKCVERVLPEASRDEETILAFMAAQRDDYGESWQELVEIYDGIPELLRRLAERGRKLAVLSNKDHLFAQRCIEHFFPDVTFDAVQGYTNTILHKPDPSGARKIANYLQLPAEALAMVGDTAMDIATALACNMTPVGVLWGFRGVDELKNAGARLIIDHPLELLAVTEQRNSS
ncbi:MAG TPA: HAD family hydrolase [Pseudomonadales bacterium]|nr:HAD family hydrolase [Pseudomonadales bacterium]